MTVQTYSCPACGGPLTITNEFSSLVVCPYCNTSSTIKVGNLTPIGETARLAPARSNFKVGAKGTLGDQEFKVVGRLHYRYEGGFWDEWFLQLEDETSLWLQEDEGNYSTFKKERLKEPVPPFDEIEVGSTISVNGRDVFISEKNEALIGGGEGELFFSFTPGEFLEYVDGSANGEAVSIEFGVDEIGISFGHDIPRAQVRIHKDESPA